MSTDRGREGQATTIDGYAAGGYGSRAIGFGAHPAVLVIDVQRSHTSSEYPYGGLPQKLKALENIVRVCEMARVRDVPVAVCNTAYRDASEMPYWKIATVRERYLLGNPAVEIDPRVVARDRDLVFTKPGVSMFYETPLQHFLIKRCVDTVIVTGVHTSGCIRMTAVDAFQRGYRTIVPEDCVADIDQAPHDDNLRDIGRRYVDVVRADDVLRYLAAVRVPAQDAPSFAVAQAAR